MVFGGGGMYAPGPRERGRMLNPSIKHQQIHTAKQLGFDVLLLKNGQVSMVVGSGVGGFVLILGQRAG